MPVKGWKKLKHYDDWKTVRTLSRDQVASMATVLLDRNVENLDVVIQSAESTVLQVWIAKVAKKAIESGDPYALNVLLDRIIGKVKDDSKDLEAPHPLQAHLEVMQRIPRPQLISMLRSALEQVGQEAMASEPLKDDADE